MHILMPSHTIQHIEISGLSDGLVKLKYWFKITFKKVTWSSKRLDAHTNLSLDAEFRCG